MSGNLNTNQKKCSVGQEWDTLHIRPTKSLRNNRQNTNEKCLLFLKEPMNDKCGYNKDMKDEGPNWCITFWKECTVEGCKFYEGPNKPELFREKGGEFG